MKQQKLFHLPAERKEFGGSLAKNGKRKSKRSLDSKRPLHLVLRADVRGKKSLLHHWGFIELYLLHFSQKFSIKIVRKAVVGNHTHIVITFKTRENYTAFIRSLTGTLAKQLKIQWENLPYTKIIEWGRQLKGTLAYVAMNELEGLGLIAYTPRRRTLP